MSEENVLFAKQSDTPPAEEIPAESQSDKYLICVSDSLLYGIDAEQVVEIITDHTITYLPRVPHYVRGIINLRGQLIPIIDMRLRLGKMPEDEHCIMVVNVENNVVGLLVDGGYPPGQHPAHAHPESPEAHQRHVLPAGRGHHACAGLQPAPARIR